MKIKVKFFKLLRELTGKTEDEVQTPRAITIDELLTQLSKKYGRDFVENLYDKKGKVQEYVQILINGKDIKVLDGLETKLGEGDTVSIFTGIGRY